MKKVLVIVLALCMALTVFPVMAFADTGNWTAGDGYGRVENIDGIYYLFGENEGGGGPFMKPDYSGETENGFAMSAKFDVSKVAVGENMAWSFAVNNQDSNYLDESVFVIGRTAEGINLYQISINTGNNPTNNIVLAQNFDAKEIELKVVFAPYNNKLKSTFFVNGREVGELITVHDYTSVKGPRYGWMFNCPTTGGVGVLADPSVTANTVAQIGETKYGSLATAIDAVQDGETITMIGDVKGAHGISVPSGKNFTIDFDGHSYSVEKPGAGSANTKTQAFQLLKDSKITFKNGTISCTEANKDFTWSSGDAEKGVAMIIQNYADLTLDNMTIDGTNIAHNGSNVRYVVSNNCGNVVIKDTTITACDGDIAFDSCKQTEYDAPTVTVNNSNINGNIEVTGGKLVLESGNVSGFVKTLSGTSDLKGGTINGTVRCYDNGIVNVDGAKIIVGNDETAVVVWGDGTFGESGCKTPTLNVKSGEIEGKNAAIITNGNDKSDPIINIEGGSILNDAGTAIYAPAGIWTISGGYIEGKTALYFKSEKLNVTGGEFKGTGTKADYSFNGNGCNDTGDAVVIDNCGYPNGLNVNDVVISGGTFFSENASAIGSYYGNGQAAALSGFISGGTFSSDPKALIAEGNNIYKKSTSPVEYVVGTTEPTHSSGMNTWTLEGDYYVESYVAPYIPAGGSGSSEKSVVSAQEEEIVVAPKATAKDGEVQVEITEKNIDKAITLAEKNESESIVLEPVVSSGVAKVEIDIPVEAAQKLVEKTDATLVVKAETGSLSIPNETLAEIVEAAEGEDIEINIDAVEEKTLKEKAAKLDDEPVLAVEVTITSGGKTISSFGGKSLEVRVPVDSKKFENGKAFAAYIFSADGSVEKTTAVIVNGEAVVIMSHFSTLVLTEAAGTVFEDAADQWYEDIANYCYAKGLFIGDEKKHFNGDYVMSEAELCTVLYRIVNGKEPDPAEGDEWYSAAAKWAKDNKIDETFVAEGKLARGTFIKMFYDTLKLTGKYDTKVTSAMRSALKKNAADYDDIAAADIDAVAWSVNAKLIIGYDTDELVIGPSGEITRAEVATMLMRYYQGL